MWQPEEGRAVKPRRQIVPRTAGGKHLSTRPVKHLVSQPRAHLTGRRALPRPMKTDLLTLDTVKRKPRGGLTCSGTCTARVQLVMGK